MRWEAIDSFLPGRLALGRGDAQDYAALARFHYRAGRPATWAGVWVVRYVEREQGVRACAAGTRLTEVSKPPDARRGRVVAVAVLSYPTVNSGARERALGLVEWKAGARLRFVNGNVRTISRVVVHPQFRGVGLASRLVRRVCEHCPTRWVEAFAVMGRVHPFFERGGMRRVEGGGGEGAVYYLWEGDVKSQKTNVKREEKEV